MSQGLRTQFLKTAQELADRLGRFPELGEAVKGLESAALTRIENDANHGHPIRKFPVDQMFDDFVTTPGLGAFVVADPNSYKRSNDRSECNEKFLRWVL
jgi:hypothetical protein